MGNSLCQASIGQYYGESARESHFVNYSGGLAGSCCRPDHSRSPGFSKFFQLAVFNRSITDRHNFHHLYLYWRTSVDHENRLVSILLYFRRGYFDGHHDYLPAKCPNCPHSQVFFPFNSHFSPFDLFILILTFSSTFVVGPRYLFACFLCKRFENSLQERYCCVALVLIPFGFVLSYVGIYSATFHSGAQNSSSLVNLANSVLPEWAVGILVAALISAVLSTAATTLLTASMILSELFHKDINNKKSFRQTKLFIIGVGILSMVYFIENHLNRIGTPAGSFFLFRGFYNSNGGRTFQPTLQPTFKHRSHAFRRYFGINRQTANDISIPRNWVVDTDFRICVECVADFFTFRKKNCKSGC